MLDFLKEDSVSVILEYYPSKNVVLLNPAAKNLLNTDKPELTREQFVIEHSEEHPELTKLFSDFPTQKKQDINIPSFRHYKWNTYIQEQPMKCLYIVGAPNIEAIKYSIKNYYENIITLIPGHLYWQDLDWKFLGCNDQQAQSAGFKDRKDMAYKTIRDMPCYKDNPEIIKKLEQVNDLVIHSGEPHTIEEPGVRPDGTDAFFLSKKHPLRDETGKIIGILGISFDITDRKRAEEHLKIAKQQADIANQAKSDFIACMSHDLRTPLSGIYGAVQILQHQPHYPEQTQFLESIQQSVNQLLFLIEDILNFAKLESGNVQLSEEDFDMRKLVEDIINLFAHQARQKNLRLIVSYCDSVPRNVITDPNAIRRILINLVGNAIKFTEFGHIFVSVDLVETNDKEAIIQVTVEDTGIGIPKSKIELIFEKFSRLNPSYNGRYAGTGLGLTIAKQLAEKLGGTINVNSQLDCGSTFWCALPVKLQAVNQSDSKWLLNYKDVRVLIVDDYDVRAANIKKQLSSSKNKTIRSNLCISELEKACSDNNPFRVVIIDDEIISQSAIDLARNIRFRSEFSNIMLILVSSPRTLSENEVAKNSGFYRQFVKPTKPEQFLNDMADAWMQWLSDMENTFDDNKQYRYSVLLVEDDSIAQMIAKTMLKNLGCLVENASSGQLAYQMACEKYYDYIFMDVGLPDVDGITITKRILAKLGKNTDTKIIGLTAHAFDHNRVECISAGMAGFITKPVTYEDFVAALREYSSSEHSTTEGEQVTEHVH